MIEGGKPNMTIPEDIERQFQGMVLKAIQENPLSAGKPPKYAVGSRVVLPALKVNSVEIKKSIADIYLLYADGEYFVCNENDIKKKAD